MIEGVPEKIERRKVKTEYHQNDDQQGTEFFPFLNGAIEKIIRKAEDCQDAAINLGKTVFIPIKNARERFQEKIKKRKFRFKAGSCLSKQSHIFFQHKSRGDQQNRIQTCCQQNRTGKNQEFFSDYFPIRLP